MKILFLSDNDVEHMADILYHGLVEVYGEENIIDFPRKSRYHVKDMTPSGFSYFNWCRCPDNRENIKQYSFLEIKEMINNHKIDMIISSIRAYPLFSTIIDNTNPIGTVIINGEDHTDEHYLGNLIPNFSKYWNRIDMILQREYKTNILFERKVIPFPCPCPLRNLPNLDFKENQEIDVFCLLGNTHPLRKNLREKISSLKDLNILVSDKHLSFDDYFKTMNNSKISIMMGGNGWESTHYLDIPLAKSMLLAQHPKNAIHAISLKEDPVIYPMNFVDKQSAVFYKNDLTDIEELIRYYLQNDKERKEITKNGYDHLVNNLSAKKIAEYVINCRFDFDFWKNKI